MANMTFKASLLPSSNLNYSLGSNDKKWKINGYTLEDTYVKKSGDTMTGSLTIKRSSEPVLVLRNTSYGGEAANARITLTMTDAGSQGLWSSGYFDGTNYTTSGKWLVERQPNGEIIVNGNAATATKLKTARTLTIGGTGKDFDGSANVSWSHAEIGATVSNTWAVGTTAGPTIKTTVNGVTGTAVAIPSASGSASGIVTTGTQTFAGAKTFTSSPTISGGSNPTLNIKNTDMDTHAASISAAEYSSIYFHDKNSDNNLNAWIETGQGTNGNVYLQIGTRRRNTANDGNINNALTLRAQQNGTLSVEVSSPAAWRTALGLGARATDNTAYLPLTGGTMTGAIIINKSAEQLVVPYNGTNYDVLHNHNNGNYSLSACGNGLYMGYYNTNLMDWLAGKMSLSKTGNLALNNGLLQITNYNNTLYIGNQNTDWCHFSSSKKFYFNQNIEINGQYTQYVNAVASEAWITGRNSAAVRVAKYNDYHAGLSMKTTNGSWEIGVYTSNNLWFTYAPDSYYNAGNNAGFSQCHIDSAGRLWGAVWNDYAEMRNVPEANDYIAESPSTKLAGRCVRDVGDGTMTLTTERLQRGGKIVSDTFGFNIGETEDCKTPIAVSGRALVYIHEGREVAAQHIGWPVGTGPDGTVSIMTEEEEEKYPSRIVGTISEIPTYETWGEKNININNRIWIYVK